MGHRAYEGGDGGQRSRLTLTTAGQPTCVHPHQKRVLTAVNLGRDHGHGKIEKINVLDNHVLVRSVLSFIKYRLGIKGRVSFHREHWAGAYRVA